MSEFQYYEFRAIDRALTPEEQGELRAISTRAEITSTTFTNEYNWGDLKAAPSRLVERYFDAHFYLANWGRRTLMFRFPSELVGQELVPYHLGEAIEVWTNGEHTLLRFDFGFDGHYHEDDWWLQQDVLDDLIELRRQILRGDLRCLYMMWLDPAARYVEAGDSGDEFEAAAARQQAEAERRQRRLEELAGRWEHYWDLVFEAIDERNRAAYSRGAALMVELADAAASATQTREFAENVRAIRQEYAVRSAPMDEMDKAGLPRASLPLA